MDGWMDGWVNGWTDGWMDGWTDGRTDGPTKRDVESRSTRLKRLDKSVTLMVAWKMTDSPSVTPRGRSRLVK